MPSLANITVKKADGTTDVVYTAALGATADKSPAIFISKTQGTTLAANPKFELSSQWNGPRTARRVNHRFTFPISSVKDGVEMVVGNAIFEGSAVIPQAASAAQIKEWAYQYSNLMAAALTKASLEEGFAPR